MNIKITHNWLLEYLETDANPYEIQKYLSLSGPSVETVEKIGDDYVYNIEVISNRIDYVSVLGIAREAAAILPMFGKKASLKKMLVEEPKKSDNKLPLTIIDPENLCPRKLAVVMDVKISNSPKYIEERLENCEIRSLNNLIDITNYVMLEIGHPAHVFDYDLIKTGKILIRKAKKSEKITTLDDKSYFLDQHDIVFDDGTGRIIDLPGIMGLANSVVTDQTKRIVFWIESNNPQAIRRTSMRLGIRTMAASMNEKDPDPETAKLAFLKGIALYQKIAKGRVASPLYDIYLHPIKEKIITFDYQIFDKLIGLKIDRKTIDKVLASLGFQQIGVSQVKVPSWRTNDINIPEDLVEEVARVYGYHRLPNCLPPPANVHQPEEFEKLFTITAKIKNFLKHLGLNEVVNYSMISKKMIENWGLKVNDHLRLANTISDDIEYLRLTLLPSLFSNIKKNAGKKDVLKFFEIAKIYLPRKNDLPEEIYKLGIAVNTEYFDLKGIVEALYKELNILEQLIKIIEKDEIFMIEIDLQSLINHYHQIPKYQPINPYAVIKLDKTFSLAPDYTYEVIRRSAEQSKLLQKIDVVSLYKNKLSLKFYYSSSERNIIEEEAKKELSKIN